MDGSWGELLNEFKLNFDIDVDLENEFKPFPLDFDEILHQKGGSNRFENWINAICVKEFLHSLCKNIPKP